jgi:hypothetical protein
LRRGSVLLTDGIFPFYEIIEKKCKLSLKSRTHKSVKEQRGFSQLRCGTHENDEEPGTSQNSSFPVSSWSKQVLVSFSPIRETNFFDELKSNKNKIPLLLISCTRT